MEVTDWLEIKELVRGAEGALLSGQLKDWQHADCTSFHVLASAILDLNERLESLYSGHVAHIVLPSHQPMEDAPVNGPSIYRGDKF